jgi:hypothetical protein
MAGGMVNTGMYSGDTTQVSRALIEGETPYARSRFNQEGNVPLSILDHSLGKEKQGQRNSRLTAILALSGFGVLVISFIAIGFGASRGSDALLWVFGAFIAVAAGVAVITACVRGAQRIAKSTVGTFSGFPTSVNIHSGNRP